MSKPWLQALLAGAITTIALSLPQAATAAGSDAKRVCVYTGHSIATLQQFDSLVGRDVDCVMVFSNSSTTWSDWENPWFLHASNPDSNWTAWATAPGTGRQLVISQNLFPSSENGSDWRTAGAAGDYEAHAQALARNLVAAGLGDAVIRLSPEANGDWNSDSVGDTQTEYDLWRQFWRNTVMAMRSVPGANFSFDWCINAHVRPIPLADFYPGDDVVDIVGIDAYDSGVPAGLPRWATIFGWTDGIKDALDFARAHGKPLSIPEWGVAPADTSLSGGDDPEYVDGIAGVVRDNPVAYHAYFYRYGYATQLAEGTASLEAYRRHFGDGGDSVEGATAPAPEPAPTPDPAPVPDPAPPPPGRTGGATAPPLPIPIEPPLPAGAAPSAGAPAATPPARKVKPVRRHRPHSQKPRHHRAHKRRHRVTRRRQTANRHARRRPSRPRSRHGR
jgi:hypothetical protein